MGDAEPAPTSIADRIAALKLAHVGRVPGQSPTPATEKSALTEAASPAPTPRPRPPPPPRPQSTNNPPTRDHGSVGGAADIGNRPAESPYAPLVKQPARPVPPRPSLPPRTSSQASQISKSPGLPPRRPSGQPSPALPPRRPSETPSQLSRRESNESLSSVTTAVSSISALSNGTSMTSQSERNRMRVPEYDPATLPVLPPKRTQEEKEADARKYAGLKPLRPSKSSPRVQQEANQGTTPPPSYPRMTVTAPMPNLPSRRTSAQSSRVPLQQLDEEADTPPPQPARPTTALPPRPRQSALSYAMNQATETPPPLPGLRPGATASAETAPALPGPRPSSVPRPNGFTPPVPSLDTRPDLSSLLASKPQLNGHTAASTSCLLCRDFTGPDDHAARFPRESIPSTDTAWLADQLTRPFASLTDKARALFVWCHHNINYDTVSFFAKNIKPSTPQSTIQSGLAVCEGYAGLFAALAVKAGLEAIVIGGASKGFGYKAIGPNDPIPPFASDHAWNAVRIDHGEWKLIDACWGAGHLDTATNSYARAFHPERFTQSNDHFGFDHYPTDNTKQYRNDGRTLPWAEFIRGNDAYCAATVYKADPFGFARHSFVPRTASLDLAALRRANPHPDATLRFSFQRLCPHWDPLVHSASRQPRPLFVLHLDSLEGDPTNRDPFNDNGDVWWLDVPLRSLGAPGQKVKIFAITKWDGRDGAGLTRERYAEKRNRTGWAADGVAEWTIA